MILTAEDKRFLREIEVTKIKDVVMNIMEIKLNELLTIELADFRKATENDLSEWKQDMQRVLLMHKKHLNVVMEEQSKRDQEATALLLDKTNAKIDKLSAF